MAKFPVNVIQPKSPDPRVLQILISRAISVAVLIAIVPGVRAQTPTPASIADVRVGFVAVPGARESEDDASRDLFKAGRWVPVYVRVNGASSGRIHVETTDADDTPNIYTVSFSDNGQGSDVSRDMVAYTKPGSIRSDIKVSLEVNGAVVSSVRTMSALPPENSLVLSLGSMTEGLNRALSAARNPETPSAGLASCRLAWAGDVQALPDHWFGYTAADVVILNTSKLGFLDAFLRDHSRQAALGNWVRRGGHLLISCGRNSDTLAELAAGLHMPAPFTATAGLPARSLEPLRTWTSGLHGFPVTGDTFDGGVRLQREGDHPAEWLLPMREDVQSSPVVVRWPFGCGQVTLVAIDLDESPFTSWVGEAEFWNVLLVKCGIRRPSSSDSTRVAPKDGSIVDLTTQLQQRLDQFPQIGTVSFGWVAVLLLGLLIILGPFDYFVLKCFTKRLEWTWLTFPTIALLVSVTAWLSAADSKGDTQRINKVDLVDIDLVDKRVYGTTWFTVFSPRSRLYTIGLEPAAPTWVSDSGARAGSSVVMSWLGRPEAGFGGYHRPSSQPIFHQAYRFTDDAAGLIDVPISVWASKSFTARWEGALASDRTPSRLVRRLTSSGLNGVFVNPLNVVLHDAVLIHGENESQVRVYPLGTLVPNQSKPLAAVRDTQLSQWLSQTGGGAASENFELMRRIMFFDASANVDGARSRAQPWLDQSWRRSLPNAAMLIARIPRREGGAEEISNEPMSPSRLWLGGLPSDGHARPPLEGTITQDTIVRIFVPLEPMTRGQP